eukprot:m.34356 g.34356  ORF g.34356 m.34356 type:complete len:1012 (+) comp31968_c0_seq4:18-3053(+)
MATEDSPNPLVSNQSNPSFVDSNFHVDVSAYEEGESSSLKLRPKGVSPEFSPMVERKGPFSQFSHAFRPGKAAAGREKTPVRLSKGVDPYLLSSLKRFTPGRQPRAQATPSADYFSPVEERPDLVSRFHRRSRGGEATFSEEVQSALKFTPGPRHSRLEFPSTAKKTAEKVRFLLDESLLTPASHKKQQHHSSARLQDTLAGDEDASSIMSEPESTTTVEKKMFTLAFKAEQHPALSVAQNLFTEFHEHLDACSGSAEIFDLLGKYENACLNAHVVIDKAVIRQARRSFASPTRSRSFELGLIVKQEKYTWRLISSLYKDRNSLHDDDDDDDGIIIGYDEKKIARTLFKSDAALRQQQIVIDWLEKNQEDEMQELLERDQVGFATDKVCWEHTLHELKTEGAKASGHLVTALDPDAPVRQKKQLHPEDAEDEDNLLRDMFVLVRAGKVDQAQKLCMNCGQYWRAATLDGWRLWHDPNYYVDSEEILPVEGNPNRDLWKNVCWIMTDEERYGNYEKAIYAALTGNLKQLLPFIHSWPDGLWAHYKTMVDVNVERELRSHPRPRRPHADLPNPYWDQIFTPQDVFRRIEQYADDCHDMVKKFHVVQKCIILDDIPGLFQVFENWLKGKSASAYMLRFMTHFVLFLRAIRVDGEDEDVAAAIVEQYAKNLTSEKQHKLVATYTAALPLDRQTDVYAELLEGVLGSDDKQECLKLAEHAGLNVPEITKAVVEKVHQTAEDTFTMDMTYVPQEVGLSEMDKRKIGAIDWLVFEPRQRAEALRQANSLMRAFLASSKVLAVQEVLQKIPKDSIAIIHRDWSRRSGGADFDAQTANAIREYMSIKAYTEARVAFDDWFRHYHHERPIQPVANAKRGTVQEGVVFEQQVKKFERDQAVWQSRQKDLNKTASDKMCGVLMFFGGWLVDEVADDWSSNRSQQMVQLRRLCLPGMADLLHQVLHSSGMYEKAIQIADMIASQKYRLFEVFSGDEIQKVLRSIRRSCVELLRQNSEADPLGYE